MRIVGRGGVGVADLVRSSLDLLSGPVIIIRDAPEHMRHVELPRRVGQASSMLGLVPVVGCAVHTF